MPGVGTSLILIAVGAILRYAVTVHISGLSVPTVGLILMVAGAIGLVCSILVMTLPARDAPPPRRRGPDDRDYRY